MLTRDLVALYEYSMLMHEREWCVTRLPGELGVKRIDREVEPLLLGVAVQGYGRRAIGVNELILGTPLEIPVIAHECAHLLLGHAIGYCAPGSLETRQEHDAWVGAALLSVPCHDAEFDNRWLMHACRVPRELLALRHDLFHVGSTDGAYQHLRRWLIAMTDGLLKWK